MTGPKSKTGKAIKVMTWAVNRYQPLGQNWKIYRIMDLACKKYGIEYPEANNLQADVLNGWITG